MKILITCITLCALAIPLTAHAFDWNVPWDKDKQTRMERDRSGGYSEQQRDYKAKRRRTQKEKEGEAYYQGSYHMKGEDYKASEWQIIK